MILHVMAPPLYVYNFEAVFVFIQYIHSSRSLTVLICLLRCPLQHSDNVLNWCQQCLTLSHFFHRCYLNINWFIQTGWADWKQTFYKDILHQESTYKLAVIHFYKTGKVIMWNLWRIITKHLTTFQLILVLQLRKTASIYFLNLQCCWAWKR